LCLALAAAAQAADPAAWTAARTDTPRNVEELSALQQKVQAAVAQARLCTVALVIGNSQGSGVIVSQDGYILTAGHVAHRPGLEVLIFLSDGRRLHGKTLGINTAIDSGLVKITEPGDWPYVPMGHSADLHPGQWCLALGHPNGYHHDRPPVLRLGRVLEANSRQIMTDCTLVSGDSGGPLFDLDGRVIGINSRIGEATIVNVHVPVDTYRLTWQRLTRGEAWGHAPAANGALLGLNAEDHARGCRVINVLAGGPADHAGVQVGDVITQADADGVDGLDALADIVGRHQPGDALVLHLLRAGDPRTVTVTLGQRKSD
jgi:serine protease Do